MQTLEYNSGMNHAVEVCSCSTSPNSYSDCPSELDIKLTFDTERNSPCKSFIELYQTEIDSSESELDDESISISNCSSKHFQESGDYDVIYAAEYKPFGESSERIKVEDGWQHTRETSSSHLQGTASTPNFGFLGTSFSNSVSKPFLKLRRLFRSGQEEHHSHSTKNEYTPQLAAASNILDANHCGSPELKVVFQNRLRSFWNNVKFGWNMNTNFSAQAPIYLLGRKYDFACSSQNSLSASLAQAFCRDFASRIWLSYRHGFPPLPSPHQQIGIHQINNGISPTHTSRTSDCGWGCMLRTGQMMLAQGLLLHFLSRDWSLFSKINPRDSSTEPNSSSEFCRLNSERNKSFHRQIIRWFADSLHLSCPLSIHKLLQLSREPAGHWFGPATVCHLLTRALRASHSLDLQLATIDIYLANDRQVYVQDVRKLFCNQHNHHDEHNYDQVKFNSEQKMPSCCSKAVIILVPMYLGGSNGFQSSLYANVISQLFEYEDCLGIIGGRPKHSLYFIGAEDRELLYLDPHFSQPAVDISIDPFPTKTYHFFVPKKISINKLDPSCAVGFYCRSSNHFTKLLEIFQNLYLNGTLEQPLIEIMPGSRPAFDDDFFLTKDNKSSQKTPNSKLNSKLSQKQNETINPFDDDDDFVFL